MYYLLSCIQESADSYVDYFLGVRARIGTQRLENCSYCLTSDVETHSVIWDSYSLSGFSKAVCSWNIL